MLKPYDAYLVGYYGMGNCGDDALLLASLWGAQRHLSLSRLKVAGYAPIGLPEQSEHPQYLQEHQRFRGQNRLHHYRAAMRSKRIIFGGGSVLHSEKDINLKRHLMTLSSPQHSMALGVGLGPFQSRRSEKACRQFLRECGLIAVRDSHSYELARHLAPEANVVSSFDLAPSLCLHPSFPKDRHFRSGIGINLCPAPLDAFGSVSEANERERLARIAELIEQIWAFTQQQIVLISFNRHPVHGDDALLMKLKSQIHPDIPVTLERYNGNPFSALALLKRLKLVIGMRLHACIMSYMTDTPFFSLGYHSKCEEFCTQIGQDPKYQFDAGQIDTDELITQLEVGLHFGFYKPLLPLQQAIAKSLLNWQVKYEKSTVFRRHSLV